MSFYGREVRSTTQAINFPKYVHVPAVCDAEYVDSRKWK